MAIGIKLGEELVIVLEKPLQWKSA